MDRTIASTLWARNLNQRYLSSNGVHGTQGFNESGGVDLVTFPFDVYVLADYFGDGFIGGIFPEQMFHVDFIQREQAVTQFAVSGQANAIAAQAKRSGDGGDDAD